MIEVLVTKEKENKMEREEIYRRHIRYGTSFEGTLILMQSLLSERLRPEFRKIWVQGTSRGRLCFTIFVTNSRDTTHTNCGYTMRFFNTGGLRQFRTTEPLESEMVIMERFLEQLRQGVLSDFIE